MAEEATTDNGTSGTEPASTGSISRKERAALGDVARGRKPPVFRTLGRIIAGGPLYGPYRGGRRGDRHRDDQQNGTGTGTNTTAAPKTRRAAILSGDMAVETDEPIYRPTIRGA